MTTNNGHWRAERAANFARRWGEPEVDYPPERKEGSGRHCHRCRNEIWKESGLYIRKKNTNEWMVFCRMDCATLHFGAKRASQLISYEEWCTLLTHEAIKKKS